MTPELRKARLGMLTASKAGVIMGGLDTSGLDGLVRDLAFERVYGESVGDGYQSAFMLAGKENEAAALEWYQFDSMATDLSIDPDRTVPHPRLAYVTATPDALRADRTVESKAPQHRAWMEVQRTAKVPSEYRWQADWQMWTCEREMCDFVAWHPVCGGLVVPYWLEDERRVLMEQRAPIVNNMVEEWEAILRGEFDKAGALAKVKGGRGHTRKTP